MFPRLRTAVLTIAFLALPCVGAAATPSAVPGDWGMNATIIEACSCPMFCQCYFSTKPAAHTAMMAGGEHDAPARTRHGRGAEHFCKFNNAFR